MNKVEFDGSLEIKKIYDEISLFLDKLLDACEEIGFVLDGFSIDHVCMRTDSIDLYNHINKSLHDYNAVSIGEKDNKIGGRPITLRQLPAPIIYKNNFLDKEQDLQIIEVTAPKDNHHYENGIQHAEFYPRALPKGISSKQCLMDILEKHKKGLKREIDFTNEYNPTIAHSFNKDLEIKIHPYPIDWVVSEEERNSLSY